MKWLKRAGITLAIIGLLLGFRLVSSSDYEDELYAAGEIDKSELTPLSDIALDASLSTTFMAVGAITWGICDETQKRHAVDD